MRKMLVAMATATALGAGGVSSAHAQEPAGPFIAGAVIGTVIGVVLANQNFGVIAAPVAYPPPPRVVYAPPPRVVYAPPSRVVYVNPPVVIRQGPPKHVYYTQYRRDTDWRNDGHHPGWH